MESLSLFRRFIRYTSATVVSLLVFSLYTIVDGLFVARGVGQIALSAVNLAVPFTNMLFSVAVLFAVGTSTLIAVSLGAHEGDRANQLFSQNICTLLVLGAMITALVFLFLRPFAHLLGATGGTLSYTLDYLRGWAPFSLCVILSYNFEILVKTDGHPRLALITVIAGCLANCAMDYIAIFLLHLGTFGAGLASGLSQLLTVVIYLCHFFGENTTLRFVRFRFDFSLYRQLLPLGFSDGTTELCTGVMIFLFNHTVLRCIGQDGLVAYSLIAYINTLVTTTLLGIPQGVQPLISYYYGRKEPKHCFRLLCYGGIAIGCLSLLFLFVCQFFAPQLVQLFLGTGNPGLNALSCSALRRYCIAFLPLGFNLLVVGFLTAVESPRGAIILSMGRGLILQGACLLLLSAVVGGSAIWFAPLVSELLCLLLSLLFLRRFQKISPIR